MQAIVATTKTAAECARFDNITGSLVPGKRADILAVDGDPLADIAVLQQSARLALIMKDGYAFKGCARRSRAGQRLAPLQVARGTSVESIRRLPFSRRSGEGAGGGGLPAAVASVL